MSKLLFLVPISSCCMATLKKVGVGSLLFSPDTLFKLFEQILKKKSHSCTTVLLMFVLMSRGLKEDYGSRLIMHPG